MAQDAGVTEKTPVTFKALSAMIAGAIALVTITITILMASLSVRDTFEAKIGGLSAKLEDKIGGIEKSVQNAREEARSATQGVRDEVRTSKDDLLGRIADIKQQLAIAELKSVDRWTATDMKRLWAEFRSVWADLKRSNPALGVPDLPDIK